MSEKEYDIIIVGAGSSGGALAARLSEDHARSVLLLEAGPVYRNIDELPVGIRNPADSRAILPGSKNNWTFLASLTDTVEMPVVRGKGLGGSSSINGAYFIRGLPENFDEWVRMGNDEWSYEKVLPYFKRLESDKDFPDDDRHGASGPIPVRREPNDRAPGFIKAFTQACVDLGHPLDPDKNSSGAAGGVGAVPMNIDQGLRVGTAIGYILPSISRPNLDVVGNAFVHRAVFDGDRCVGVEVDVKGKTSIIRAGEVVLSAGALRSPQLLMLSGIGPAADLRAAGVGVRVDLPGVGQNLTDHPELNVGWKSEGPLPAMPGRGIITSALHWTAEGSDRPSDLEILPFVASPNQVIPFSAMARHPIAMFKAMRGTPLQLLRDQARAAKFPFIIIGLQQPDSRGAVTLASSDPSDPPRLRYNVFGEESDRRRFREAIRRLDEIFASGPMRDINASLLGLEKDDLVSDKSVDAWATNHLFVVGHPSCTCKMGPSSDPMAVVDQYGRVYGVENLRVCDTSIFPEIPSRGPNATAIMLGERMSDFIANPVSQRADTRSHREGTHVASSSTESQA